MKSPSHAVLRDETEMRAFAERFARGLKRGDVVALSGALGSGKTTFVRCVVRELHGRDETTSPTFTFRHRYAGEPPIDHIDLFRIEDPSEVAELGLEEAFEGASIVFVEWWHNAPHLLSTRTYDVHIEGAGDAPRTIDVRDVRA
jgi:tRNA threonylcarbamoyladenosine biosynthesis protein TsaE